MYPPATRLHARPNVAGRLHTRPDAASRGRWGGIFKLASYGDHVQLLPIRIRAMFDPRQAKPGLVEAVGSLAFTNFVNPPEEEDGPTARTICVYMNKILRQDDPRMLRLLTHMRAGQMGDGDADLLLSCCLENLEPEERAKFKDAVHLTPTWAEAYRVMAYHLTNTLTGPIALFKTPM